MPAIPDAPGEHEFPDAPATSGDSRREILTRFSAVGRDGELSPLASIGGWRGIAETVLPGLIFTLVFTVTRQLAPALISALAAGLVLAGTRLAQRQPLTQAFSGILGIAICAVFAARSGDAVDFFVPGLIVNAVYGAAFLVSLAVRWPVAGLLFGFLRGEGLAWRENPRRRRVYAVATVPLVALFAVRLLVKVPLYLAGQVTELGIANAVLGVPAFALALWVSWLMSRPAAAE